MRNRITILVSGMIAADPWQGGATWAVLQYVLGLRRLGHEVYLVEPLPQKAARPAGSQLAASTNADYFGRVIAEFALCERSALLLEGTRQTYGLPYDQLRKIAQRADLLLNISGMLKDEALTAPIPIRVYLDINPAFNQLWSAVQGVDMRFAGHTHFAAIGQSIGDPDCAVPDCGLPWLKTVQPIVLEHWPVAKHVTYDALPAIANWRAYGSIDHQGVKYGQKVHSLRQFFSLPTLTQEKFILALAIHPNETEDLAAFAKNGWQVLDPARVTNTPAKYQEFVQGSKAEFGIAKSGYVLSHCGWFSDRSVCNSYWAAGADDVCHQTAPTAIWHCPNARPGRNCCFACLFGWNPRSFSGARTTVSNSSCARSRTLAPNWHGQLWRSVAGAQRRWHLARGKGSSSLALRQ